jgi:DNA/RNA endonuclease G (NUC1)
MEVSMDARRKSPVSPGRASAEPSPQVQDEPPPPPKPQILEPEPPRLIARIAANLWRRGKPMMSVLLPAGKNVLIRAERAPIETRSLMLGPLFVRGDPSIRGADAAILGMRASTAQRFKVTKVVAPGASILDLVANDEGWKDIQWLLERADAAARAKSPHGVRNDGKVSLGELLDYVENPLDGQALSSTKMHELRTAVAVGGSASPAQITSLAPWMQTVARYAAGSTATAISLEQLDAYLTDARSDAPSGKTRWITNNSLAALISGLRFADKQADGDFLSPKPISVPNPLGAEPNLYVLLDPYKRMTVDLNTRNPVLVTYLLDAADQQLTIPRGRKSSFHNDPVLKARISTTKDYDKSKKDQGHCAPDDDFRYSALAEWASYTMANMMPQEPVLNRNSWRMLEEQVREKVSKSGGRAIVHTGPLYTDEQGNLVPPAALARIGVKANVLVPTHCWKSILFQDSTGKNLEVWNVVMPNRADLPTGGPDALKLITDGQCSGAELQKLIGFDLYPSLPDEAKKALSLHSKATFQLSPSADVSLIGAPAGQISAPLGPHFSFARMFPELMQTPLELLEHS